MTRAARSLADWLSPAYGPRALTLKLDLDQIEALSPEREALWSRLEKCTFLTDPEKRQAAGYGPLAPKSNPWHDGRGRFTSGPGRTGDTQLVGGARRGPSRLVTVGGRQYYSTYELAAELEAAAARAEQALAGLRTRDPEWHPTPSLTDPASANGALAYFRSLAQEAEARVQVLERGNLPLGFNSHEQFRIFGRELVGGLRQAGYEDALPYMRGSAVTGRSYDQGELFDAGRVSDYDLAIVSPSMMRRAEELGIRTSNQGARTRPLDENDLNAIGIRATADGLGASANRPVSFMVYRSVNDVARRGPFVTVP